MNRRTLILILLVLLIAFSAFYFWNRQERGIILDGAEEVKLYFSTKDAMYLKAETRKIEAGKTNKYVETINELIKGPVSKELNRTIPEGVRIREIRIEGNIAYLDFNQALVDNHWGGSTGEIMTIYSIVNTITQFPEIDYAKILVEGKEIETLAGHMDTSVALEPDCNLIKE